MKDCAQGMVLLMDRKHRRELLVKLLNALGEKQMRAERQLGY